MGSEKVSTLKQVVAGVLVSVIVAILTGATVPWWWHRLPHNRLLLRSDVGASYEDLRRFLEQENFMKADQETANLLLWIVNKQKAGRLNSQDIQALPCKDLQTIDDLWKTYSNGKFGFGIQQQIWLSSGGVKGAWNSEIYEKFSETVGWKYEDSWKSSTELTYDMRAPKGHLPTDRTAMSNNDKIYNLVINSKCPF